jgi:CheY-like chemotaxis protein
LEQIVSNLLNNAAKYTEPGGHLTVKLATEGNQAVLAVADNGIGMTPELQTRVFDLFVQADRSLDRSRGGLGIGLTLVKNLVELHDGTVAASSAGAGRGSEFRVRLPLMGRRAARTTEGPVPSDKQASRPLRILVVDDNRDSARTMAKVLELDGHRVSCVYDGLSVIDQVEAQQSEVVLLDIGLPGIDGYQLAQQLRELYPTTQLLLIAMTGYGGELTNTKAIHAGFNHFLVKPVNLSSLKDMLASYQPS